MIMIPTDQFALANKKHLNDRFQISLRHSDHIAVNPAKICNFLMHCNFFDTGDQIAARSRFFKGKFLDCFRHLCFQHF